MISKLAAIRRRDVSRKELFAIVLCAHCLCVLSVGCNKEHDGRFATHPTVGRVLVEGEPQRGIVLQLIPLEGNALSETRLRPGGVTRADGSFELTTYSTGDGAPVGDYKLILFWPPLDSGGFDHFDEWSRASGSSSDYKGPPDQFVGTYFAAESSPWDVTIEDGKNDLGGVEIKWPDGSNRNR